MVEFKKISKAAIPAALDKAKRYRAINEPAQAESIALDILAVEPENHEAELMLILALTDQLKERMAAYNEVKTRIAELKSDYERAYYTGILCERRARAHFRSEQMGSGFTAYEWFQRALRAFEEAEQLRPEGKDEPLYRWNSIQRTLLRHRSLQPEHADSTPQMNE
ncbi:MAG: hypothetical protein HYV27_17535 [Candidatus Hydrogenedentes bacterium]|nr:hypothetical protein [Candidatus Hydrogenedentota bacterium]